MPDALPVLALHWIRPVWLALIPAAVLLWLWLRRRRDVRAKWQRVVEPHLLKHLVLSAGRQAIFRPEHLVPLLLLLSGLAMAGPAWSKEAPPFADDQAALVVCLDASTTMNAVDVPPTRLERAKQKVRDLLERRKGAKAGLVAYAGSAHLVLPLTEDAEILDMYLEAIATDVMPQDGRNAAAALALAADLLEAQDTPGSILFVTDAIPESSHAAFAAHDRAGGAPILVLGVGTSRGGPIRTSEGAFDTGADGDRRIAPFDRATLEAVPGAWVTTVTVDDTDVGRIAGRAEQRLQDVRSEDASLRWKDQGWAFLVPIALLAALWFRRGWTIRWAAWVLAGALWLAGSPAYAHESTWEDLWRTPDQQGRHHFERGEYEAAASHFQDPLWRGIALYEAGLYGEAVEAFALLDTVDTWFRTGNAYARLERWDEAIKAYEHVLERAPDDARATANLELTKRLQEAERKKDEEEPQEGGDQLGPDEVVESDPNDKRKRPEVEEQGYGGAMDESMAETWMRQVQTSPAEFLRAKFAIQRAQTVSRPPAKESPR